MECNGFVELCRNQKLNQIGMNNCAEWTESQTRMEKIGDFGLKRQYP